MKMKNYLKRKRHELFSLTDRRRVAVVFLIGCMLIFGASTFATVITFQAMKQGAVHKVTSPKRKKERMNE